MTDQAIASLFRGRSEDAIRETEKKYGDMCRRLAFRLLQNHEDAEECLNDAYLALWNSFEREEPKHLKAYLFKTVRYLACEKLKNRAAKKRAAPSVPLEELADILPAPDSAEQQVDARELAETLDRFLKGESERNRYVVLRRYFYCDSVGEIAAALGTTETTVSVTLNRVKKRMKEYLKKEGYPV